MASCLIIQPIHASGHERLRDAGFRVRNASAPDMVTVTQEIVGSAAAITRNAGLDRAAMAAAPSLVVLGVHGIGTDPVDIDYASETGLPVVFTPYANVQAVAEHTIALMLAVVKRIPAADRATRAGNFNFKYRAGARELCGKTLCQWRSKKGPPRRCKKGPLGGCGRPRNPREGPARDAACPQQADAAARAGGTCNAHGVKRGLGGRFS